MKTTQNHPAIRWRLFSFVILITLLPDSITAQNLQTGLSQTNEHRHDPDFPGRKKANAGVFATYTNITPPPAVIGDVTYGITNRFSAGFLAGTTGAQSLAGLKVNAVLCEHREFRVHYRMVIVLYPGRNGQYLFDRSDKHIIPWMLSMGVVDAEWKTDKGIRWSLGMGLLETHCVEGMKKFFWGHGEEEKIMPFEFFHTVQGSVSIPVSERVTFRPEVFVVMKDMRLIKTGDFKVFPVNPFLKLIYAF